MTTARLEHANITVTDPAKTADWMTKVFGWHIRWQGESIFNGHTIHIGGDDSYLALYRAPEEPAKSVDTHHTVAGLNHLALIVDDLDAAEARVKEAGFTPRSHADYEPGRRFYFIDEDGIDYELVQYD